MLKTRYINSFLFLLGALFCLVCPFVSAYEIQYEGLNDPEILELVKTSSQLEKLHETPPSTLIGLKRRAENDLINITKALHSLAYYNAKVNFNIENNGDIVRISIDAGPQYPFADFEIHYTQNGIPFDDLNSKTSLDDLDVEIGKPALPETIVDAEDELLDQLNLQGYAFPKILKRDVLVNQQEKNVIVLIDVETGPLTFFGPVTISGQERVMSSYFSKKLQWNQGDLYDPKKIEKTQELIELSGLFKSVNITHAEEPIEGNQFPIQINVIEAKQRSIGFGVNYTTDLGPGITAEWEDRNVYGEGQKLGFRLDLWQVRQEGSLTYRIPDFQRTDQNLIWTLDYHHDDIKAYTDSTLSLSGIIERKLSDRFWISYGGMYKLIQSRHSEFNGTFDLIQTPLQLRWSNTDSLLEPTRGGTIHLKSTPSLQFLSPQFGYCVNTITGTLYKSLTKNRRHVLAAKLMLGSIFGASQFEIPPPERFYAGSEYALRGYKYLTVSPLNHHHKPIGGRSLFIYSLELRNRIGKNLGLVAFYEIGNVYKNAYPDFEQPMLQSVGLGLRYYTPVGPLRLDIGIPLNRRHHVDGPFQLYFSIGQAF